MGKRLRTQTERFRASYTVGIGDQQQERKKPHTSECSAFEHERTNRRAHRGYSANWDRQVRPRTLGEASAQRGTRKALNLLTRTSLEGLNSDGWTLSKEIGGTLFHTGHVSTIMWHGNDLHEEASPQRLCMVEASLRSHFETERLLSSCPTEAVAVSLVSGDLRANRPDLRHLVKKTMREVNQATDGTLVRAQHDGKEVFRGNISSFKLQNSEDSKLKVM